MLPFAMATAALAIRIWRAAHYLIVIVALSDGALRAVTRSASQAADAISDVSTTSALFLVGCYNLVTSAGLTGIRAPARILLVVAGLSSIGIAASPEPVVGSTPQHLAWTSLGEVTIAVWPAFTGRRGSSQPLILSIRGAAIVTTVFLALLCWLVIQTQSGSVLGLAERLASSIQITWPFVVALALRSSLRTPRPTLPDQQPEPITTGARPGRSQACGSNSPQSALPTRAC
jgi:hypothetical protein